MIKHYIQEILIAFDQLCNTVLGGWADETFSARCWRRRKVFPFTFLRPFMDTLFFFDKYHCETSFMDEVGRLQSPIEERI